MPNKKHKKNKVMSYSKMSTHDECPFKYDCVNNKGMYGPPSKAADRGEHIHKLAEQYTLGNIYGVPKELKFFKDELNGIRQRVKKGTGYPEQQWSFDKLWKPCGWKDSNAWLRGKTDYHGIDKDLCLDIVDYKTGQIYASHQSQGKLYTAMGFAKCKAEAGVEPSKVHVEMMYLDLNEVVQYEYTRNQAIKLKEFFTKKINRILKATNFPAKPGNHCRYCHLKDKDGGPCKAWRKW